MSEILYKLDALASPTDNRDYQAESIFPPDISLPDEFDPRNSLLPIRNQGAEGSCVAEACAAIREIQEKKNINFEDYFSPQFVYNNRINQDGSGMYTRDAMDILFKKGILAEEDYPYGKIEKPEQISQEVFEKALNYKIKGYAYINTIQILKTAIYRNGACAFSVPVYASSIMWKPEKLGDVAEGGHCMAAIGYNKEGFILRNSWGDGGANKGYLIFPYEDWGHQLEVWTVIDSESSKPDPKYSKWYWKTWRAIKNTVVNMKMRLFVPVGSFLASIYIGITDNHWAFAGTLIIPICVVLYSMWKKLYLVKDIVS